jgi:hypothetical protein
LLCFHRHRRPCRRFPAFHGALGSSRHLRQIRSWRRRDGAKARGEEESESKVSEVRVRSQMRCRVSAPKAQTNEALERLSARQLLGSEFEMKLWLLQVLLTEI